MASTFSPLVVSPLTVRWEDLIQRRFLNKNGILFCCKAQWMFVACILVASFATSSAFLGLSSPRRRPSFRSKTFQRDLQQLWTSHQDSVELNTLYPSLEANQNGTLVVDDTHTLFYQEYGSTDEGALNALFLHGGPGAGCFPNHARFFDPSRYRIVLLDQRGAGRSTPRGSTENNTLFHLVEDCEVLRNQLGVSRWDVILGGSWGSTLAIAYAQTYPSRIHSLVLRGVCLMRPGEIDWLVSRKGGAASLSPEGWEEFSRAVGIEPKNDTGRDSLHAYYDRLLGTDPKIRLDAARSWMTWEMRTTAAARQLIEAKLNATGNESSILVWDRLKGGWELQDLNGSSIPNKKIQDTSEVNHSLRRGILMAKNSPLHEKTNARAVSPVLEDVVRNITNIHNSSNATNQDLSNWVPAQAMLTCFYSVNCHYALNNMDFLSQERMAKIRNITCIAVQGGMDTICPPDTALDLHEVWPEMCLRIATTSGHSMYDPVITHELVKATDLLADLIGD